MRGYLGSALYSDATVLSQAWNIFGSVRKSPKGSSPVFLSHKHRKVIRIETLSREKFCMNYGKVKWRIQQRCHLDAIMAAWIQLHFLCFWRRRIINAVAIANLLKAFGRMSKKRL